MSRPQTRQPAPLRPLSGTRDAPKPARSERGAPAPSRQYPFTDLGNAERLLHRFGHDLRYCWPWKKWLVWDGRRWTIDDGGAVEQRAKEVVRSIRAEAEETTSHSSQSERLKWAKSSEGLRHIMSMIALARSGDGCPIAPDELDADPWLFNVRNGTIELRAASTRPHRREDLISKLASVDFDPDAACPSWLAFLERIFRQSPALVSYVQKVAGYCLSGDTREQAFFLFHGTGSNGKSVFLNTMRALLGEYAEQTPDTTFMVRRAAEAASNDLARLRGARLVAAVETEDGQRLAESLVKRVTGDDPITARFLYQEFFTFRPQFKVVLATNHLPVVRGTEHAIWRRVRLVPFTETIPDAEQDRSLGEKLKGELPGILNWALEGFQMWLEDGSLRDPPEVLAATTEYRRDQDLFAEFVDEECTREPFASAEASALYRAYREWSERRGERGLSQRKLGEWLAQQGLQKARGGTGRFIWSGIGLTRPGDDQGGF